MEFNPVFSELNSSNNISNSTDKLVVIDMYRDELSNRMAVTLLPVMVVLGVVLVTGMAGNTLVFYIYFFKFTSSSTRTAIIALAFLDLLTCAVCIPGEILDLRFSYSFTSQILCKSLRTSTTVILVASGFTLLSVALDRYQRICHPLQKQLTSKRALYRIIISCSLAAVLAVPAAIVYGLAEIETPIEGITGLECSTIKSLTNRPLRIAYNALLFTTFLAAFATMMVIYVLIGRQVLKQTNFRRSVQQRKGSSDSLRRRTVCSETSSDGDHSLSDKMKELSQLHEAIPEHGSHCVVNINVQPGTNQIGRIEARVSRKNSVIHLLRKMSGSVDARTRKTTTMLFFITLVFVISFLPHLVLKVIQALDKHFSDSLTTTGVIFYNIFVRSYFFNTAANAFVYGFCSPKFRFECRTVLLRLAFWVKSKPISAQTEDLM
ncbi:unnamed protein product [Candidula unifasciata]|uniref:G-protein coupled receptors family 1 profile domain-containing protein n=1 Tax=Candidula unifasciata TaxID=100452 RepID=A0A8S3ZJZ7_9EUPU|nr:unnamed protein product [Candidula unifasciata]